MSQQYSVTLACTWPLMPIVAFIDAMAGSKGTSGGTPKKARSAVTWAASDMPQGRSEAPMIRRRTSQGMLAVRL